ncbi:MAG: hypothetical protein LBD87_02300, partial [Prevotellaceae bacterium]|nr:hypothetical protein [Prevotellaceae bacterium]
AVQPVDSLNRANGDNRTTDNAENQGLQQRAGSGERDERGNRNAVQPPADNNNTETATPAAGRSVRQPSSAFANINVSPQAKRYIHIASLLLIFGSYLYLRLRKAKR